MQNQTSRDPYSLRSSLVRADQQHYQRLFRMVNQIQSAKVPYKSTEQLPKQATQAAKRFQKVKFGVTQNEPFLARFILKKKQYPLRILMSGPNFIGKVTTSFQGIPNGKNFHSKFQVNSNSCIHFQEKPEGQPPKYLWLQISLQSEVKEKIGQGYLSIDYYGSKIKVPSISLRQIKNKITSRTLEELLEEMGKRRSKSLSNTNFVELNTLKITKQRQDPGLKSQRQNSVMKRRLIIEYESMKQKVYKSLSKNHKYIQTQGQELKEALRAKRRRVSMKLLVKMQMVKTLSCLQEKCQKVLRRAKNKSRIVFLVQKFIKKLKANVNYKLGFKTRKKISLFLTLVEFDSLIHYDVQSKAKELIKSAFLRKSMVNCKNNFILKAQKHLASIKNFQRNHRIWKKLEHEAIETLADKILRNQKFFLQISQLSSVQYFDRTKQKAIQRVKQKYSQYLSAQRKRTRNPATIFKNRDVLAQQLRDIFEQIH